MSWAIFLRHARLRMKERMEYRSAFLLGLIAQILGYGAGYLVLWLTLQKFSVIGDWNWPEIAFLYSLSILTYAMGAAFTYSPMIELEKLVQQGTFDPVLIRPMDPFMTLTAQMFNVGYLSHVMLSGTILFWSVNRLDMNWTTVNVIFLLLSIVSGSLIHAAIMTFVGSWTLLIVRADVLFTLMYKFNDFVNYPITIFGTAIQILLTAVVPLAFMNFFPAAVILSKDTGVFPIEVGWFSPVVGPLLMFLAYRTFNACINRYQGAGG